MKNKLMFLILTVIAVTSFSSCKKDWVCACTTGSVTNNTEIKDETLLNARSKCKAMGGSAFGVTTTCNLN